MVITRLILSVFMIGFVLLASCSKDDSTGTQTDTFTKTMSAKIDGTAWDGTSSAIVQKVSTQTTISATGGSGQQIIISLNNAAAPGTFDFTTVGNTALVYEGANIWSTGGTGSVIISTLSATNIEGTFSFTVKGTSSSATGTKTVTEGKFSLKF